MPNLRVQRFMQTVTIGSNQPTHLVRNPSQGRDLILKPLGCPNRDRRVIEGIDKRCVGLNIEFLSRFGTWKVLNEVIINRQNIDKPDGRPLAVLIFAKFEYNGALEVDNQIGELISRGYRVIYFEVGTKDEFIAALKDSTAAQRAKLFLVSAHGEQNAILLGKDSISQEEFHINPHQEDELKEKIQGCLTDDSVIVLSSCYAGKGREEENNLANMMKRIFPQAKVFAPPISARSYCVFDQQGRVIDLIMVNFAAKDTCYVATGGRDTDILQRRLFRKRLMTEVRLNL